MDNRVYLTLFVTILAVALGASLVIPLLPVYAQDLGATGFELGLIFSSFALARSLFLPLVGSLADRWGRRGFIMAGLLIYSGVAIGFDYSQSVTLLILCRLTQGIGAAMVIPLSRAYVGDLTPPGQEGRVMGHFNIAFFAGLALGPWLGGYIKDVSGISASFYVMASLGFFGFILTLLNIPKSRVVVSGPYQKKTSYMVLLSLPAMAAVFLFRLGTTIGVGVSWVFMPIYGHDVLSLSSTAIGVLISVNLMMTTILQPWVGWLADRFSRPWMTFWGGLLASISLMALPFCRNFNELLVLNLFLGATMGLYTPPLMAMAVDIGRESGFMSRIMSLLELAFSLGMVIGPLLAGLIKEAFSLGAIFLVGGSIGAAASLLSLVIHLRTPTADSPAG